jgi:hypothetical protein
MQVDTGANGSVIWHQNASPDEPTEPIAVKLGSIQEAASAGQAVMRAIEGCTRGSPVGTLGNAFFDRGTLTIDSAHEQLSYEPGSGLRGRKNAKRFFYPTWASGGGHIIVELDAKPFGKGYGLLDTGSALAELGLLDEQWWTKLAATSPSSEGKVASFTVNSWGNKLQCRLTQASTAVTVDDFQLVAREMTFCAALPFRPAIQLIGIVGMRLFRNSVLTIDYPSRLWLVEDSH